MSDSSLVTHQKFVPKLAGQISGDYRAVAPPVPIPNTEVKRCSPDGSTATGRARVGRRQSKNPTGFPVGFLVFGVRLQLEARRGGTPHARKRIERSGTSRWMINPARAAGERMGTREPIGSRQN